MQSARLPDGTEVFCLVRSEALVLDHHVAGYADHGVEVRSGDVVLDVGANIGLFGVRAVQSHADVRVFAFEPVPDIHAVLSANAARHGPGRFTALPYGLSDAPGTVRVSYYPNSPALSTAHPEMWDDDPDALTSAVKGSARTAPAEMWWARLLPGFLAGPVARRLRAGVRHVDAELRTVSQVVRDFDLDRIDLLKVDCEGAEEAVLMGIDAEHWPLVGRVVVEVHDTGGRLARLRALLAAHGLTQQAVEKEDGLEGTALVNLYALRP